MGTLKVHGEFHNVGLPDEPLPTLNSFDFPTNGAKLSGSHIGSRQEMLAMLAAEKGIQPRIETLDISEDACRVAVNSVKGDEVRYWVTLTGFEKAFWEGCTRIIRCTRWRSFLRLFRKQRSYSSHQKPSLDRCFL
jgi:alcohol dehydrogenase (NADP+)